MARVRVRVRVQQFQCPMPMPVPGNFKHKHKHKHKHKARRRKASPSPTPNSKQTQSNIRWGLSFCMLVCGLGNCVLWAAMAWNGDCPSPVPLSGSFPFALCVFGLCVYVYSTGGYCRLAFVLLILVVDRGGLVSRS
jgi:hypothetical protein